MINKIEDNKSKMFSIFFPIIATICFTIYWALGIKIFSYLGLIFYFIPIVKLDIFNSLILYYFLLPNISLFKLGIDTMALSSIFLIILFMKLLLSNKFKINISFMLIIIIYLIISFTTYCLAKNNLLILTQEFRIILDMLVVINIIRIYKEKLLTLLLKICDAYVWGCILTSVSALIFIFLQGISINDFRLEGINSDPNYYSLSLALSISLILLKIYKCKYNNIDVILIILLTIFGLMSLSRGFFVVMIINIVFFMYLIIFTNKINLNKKLLIIILLMLTIFITRDFLLDLINKLMERFYLEEYRGASGRFEIWQMYLEETFSSVKNLVWGLGSPNLIYSRFGTVAVQHNLYLEIFTGRGIFGTVIIITIYSYIFKYIKIHNGNKKNTLESMIPIGTLIIGFMSLNGITSDMGVMTIFLSFLASCVFSKIKC